ncbi:MAG: LacI family DNA-binding transcriptional regulator [Burkholderiales bacterium]|nr:LacI family DNA-binding transcriptional regulator [Opitutaceae bacterium]
MPRRSTVSPASPSPSIAGANLETIARELGVAVSTVSRALRNHPGIHPNTRLKIQTEAARLGYAVKRRSEETQIGDAGDIRHLLTLAQSVSHASQQGYLAGISRAAQAHNIGVFSHHCAAQDAAKLFETGYQPAALRVPDLAGVIFIHRWPDEVVARIAATRPVVSIIHRYPGLPVDSVGTDDESGLRLLVAHLRAGGHERIGFFGREPSFSWARSRFAAYVEALNEAGLPYEPADVMSVSTEAARGYTPPDLKPFLSAVRARIRSGVRAWVASSYVLAQALTTALREAGYSVPGDVAVTGYHGGLRVNQQGLLHPTSVETDDEALGAAAVHLLNYRMLRAIPAPSHLLLPGNLVQGETTVPGVAKG